MLTQVKLEKVLCDVKQWSLTNHASTVLQKMTSDQLLLPARTTFRVSAVKENSNSPIFPLPQNGGWTTFFGSLIVANRTKRLSQEVAVTSREGRPCSLICLQIQPSHGGPLLSPPPLNWITPMWGYTPMSSLTSFVFSPFIPIKIKASQICPAISSKVLLDQCQQFSHQNRDKSFKQILSTFFFRG